MIRARRLPRLLPLLLVLGVALTVLGAGPAQAAGYRYWSFWQADGTTWRYATEGPAVARPADGSVNGFRFAVSEDSSDSARPRTAPDFGAICGGTPPKAGHKRVALVIDPGTAADAPGGETPPAPRNACARVPGDATTAEALAQVAKPLRYNGEALLCAITGYPASGCGEQVSGPRPTATQAPGPLTTTAKSSGSRGPDSGGSGSGGPSVGVAAGAAVILALGAATVWQSRRRRGR
ncbi:SCO2322 family protein [Streptomyces sp. NPDC004609]|uniref:SCO2322 family protein n=1 Tax=Streptomyces sp. NPDC004609 TaxID=3364704 RepID=UPI0036B3A0AD